MLDTIKLKSPPLTPEASEKIREYLIRHQKTDCLTGEIKAEFYWADLTSPTGARIRVKLQTTSSMSMRLEGSTTNRPNHFVPQFLPSEHSVIIEASVHKLMLGHNITGGPTEFVPACRLFVHHVSNLFGIELNPAEQWMVERVDWAEDFQLSHEIIPNFMTGLMYAQCPKREIARYGNNSIAFKGDRTLINIYNKGAEIEVHMREFLTNCPVPERHTLRTHAQDSLRVEVQIKASQLSKDYGKKPRVCEIEEDYLCGVYDRNIANINFDPPGHAMPVRTFLDVEARLNKMYSSRKANVLFGAWCRFANVGMNVLEASTASSTLSRWKKELLDAGCSWLATDFSPVGSALPEDFKLTRDSSYRNIKVDPRVFAMLQPFRILDEAA